VDKLHQALGNVGHSAMEIGKGTTEISSVAEDLSRRTEQQAANLEQTAAALDQLTLAVGRTAEAAGHANQVVSNARKDASVAGEVVGQAISAITRIEHSSQQIGQIIGVIDEIAFQTSLLALNAGVEAARAGDAGRGFAVVAQEVRALSQRSADAARQIKELVSTSQQEVNEGVGRVTETGHALERIMTHVTDIYDSVAGIAGNARAQAQQLTEINGAVSNMDQVTQRNAAIVEEATNAGRHLDQQAQTLNQLMKSFDLGRDMSHGQAGASRRSVAA
jgi:methyl-accepting chemotaxis protein